MGIKPQQRILLFVTIAAALIAGTWFFLPQNVAIPEKDQKEIIKTISGLLYVAAGDTVANCEFGAGCWQTKFDYADRKQFFSDAGWTDYEIFMQQQRDFMKKLGRPDRGSGWIRPDKIIFSLDSDGYYTLNSAVDFSYCKVDVCNVGHHFAVDVTFKKLIERNGLKIQIKSFRSNTLPEPPAM